MACPLVWLCFLCTTKVILSDALVWTPVKVLPDRQTWMEAMYRSDCHLLGREFNTDRLEDVRVQGMTDSANSSTQYWIGATVQYTKWIRLNGCFQMDVQHMTSIVGNNTVTECYKVCDGTSFGLTIGQCVCLDNPGRYIDYGYCMATPCPDDVGEFCGLPTLMLQKCLCWYDVLDLSSDNEIGNCKTMNSKRNGQLKTAKCSEKHGFLCKQTRRIRDYREEMNWTEAGFACHREHRSQFFDGRLRKRPLRFGTYWVSIFRKQSFSWGSSPSPGNEFDCLAASVSKGGNLNVFVRKCYSRLPLLCNQPEPKIARNGSNTTEPTSNGTAQTTCPAESGGLSVISLSVGVVCGIFITLLAVLIYVVINRCRKNKQDHEIPGDRQEVTGSDVGGVHYEHIRPENRECQLYDVCANPSISYEYIATQSQGASGQFRE